MIDVDLEPLHRLFQARRSPKAHGRSGARHVAMAEMWLQEARGTIRHLPSVIVWIQVIVGKDSNCPARKEDICGSGREASTITRIGNIRGLTPRIGLSLPRLRTLTIQQRVFNFT
ncbi:hypothetical protein L917_10046 [Phytophthora nicotianae]|uniref:Uncharacterized protein n=1 Tax=Phytophthora nicotianae TaxID=4792 RepID=W2L1T4_PHYNI|nr:hypothetical protein L917_10046 [Phytophthora nicotianae]